MQRAYRLKKNKHFQTVYRRGKSQASKDLVLLYFRSRRLQIGISVSKKVGNAVARNKVKRRVREIMRSEMQLLKPGWYVIAARPGAAQATFQGLKKTLRYLLRKHDLYTAEDKGSNRQ
ncbi:MAG: ribonuclease P protein component [Eubacteriales bacterium]|nr:ribonuclease P protein component [Eubacteriales bacterium]MDD3882945.1 ribonuclease P protein component [Eubacteriales bacterium]MDD4513508.1 ribonuclease P protein component [Eubacteriales bacterium]